MKMISTVWRGGSIHSTLKGYDFLASKPGDVPPPEQMYMELNKTKVALLYCPGALDWQ